MSRNPPPADQQTILDEAWEQVVGGMGWLKSVIIGEFADQRPLSAVVADMLISFVPGVVIVTSARDAVAVILRLANHPEKREDLMEWVLLSACLIVIALPVAMAVGGAAAAGVGAVVGGIAGSELGAALRAVMLLLIKEAAKLVELVHFLQKFIKGDVLKFLRALKFINYEKPLLQAVAKFTNKLVEIVQSVRKHLENFRYVETIATTITKLAEWEKKFYSVQQDALKQMPRALAELDARLAKVLAQTSPKEAHTVAAGVPADKTVAALPAVQRVHDTPGKVFAHTGGATTAKSVTTSTGRAAAPTAKRKPKPSTISPPKARPDPVNPPATRANTKKQVVADAAIAAERERITRLSQEAADAQEKGNKVLAAAKIDEARAILRPYLPKTPDDSWDEVVKRLDVSSPKDGAVFWSGTADQANKTGKPDAARAFAEKIGGVTLETTPGGRIVDGWDEVNKGFAWNEDKGPPPWASDLWADLSEKYAEGTSGVINVVQTPDRLWDPRTIWHKAEKPTLLERLEAGKIDAINMHVVDMRSGIHNLPTSYVDKLLDFDQRK